MAEPSPRPPYFVLKGFWAGLVDNLAALFSHLGILVGTGVAELAAHARLTLALPGVPGTELTEGAQRETLAGQTLV